MLIVSALLMFQVVIGKSMSSIDICNVFSIGIADTIEEKDEIYKLRYKSYRHDAVIDQSEDEIFF